MKKYSVAALAKLAGVTIRTLHVYDQMGLLRPAGRSDSGYRFYTEPELLRLQQILFYKEMGMGLEAISDILDKPDFDLIQALVGHKHLLLQKRAQIDMMLNTIDNTILTLNNKYMLKHEELYDGLSKEQAIVYRKEAVTKYGERTIERAEYSLKNRSKEELELLKKEQKQIMERLYALIHLLPESDKVQEVIARHYQNIRKFWGTYGDADPQAATYKGLADLYISDERYIQTAARPNRDLAGFLKKAIHYHADYYLQ